MMHMINYEVVHIVLSVILVRRILSFVNISDTVLLREIENMAHLNS